MNKRLLKIAILSVGLLTVTAGPAISPALGTIALAFPHVNETTIKLLVTLPAVFIIPFIFVSSFLTKYLSKKQILLIGMFLYLIGGVGGGLAPTIGVLFATRIILGIGVGLIMPISTSLVADFYEGEERAATMGYVTAANNLSGVILFISSGLLAGLSWRASFGVYLLSVVVFLTVIFFLPTVKPRQIKVNSTRQRLPKEVYFLGGSIFLLMIAFFSVPSNMALFIQKEGVGTSQLSGFVIAVAPGFGFVAGLFLKQWKNVVRSNFIAVNLFIMAVGFICIGYSSHALVLAVGVAMMGYTFGAILPVIFNEVTKQVDKTQTMQAMAVATSMLFVGQFFCPLILDAIRYLFAQDTIRFSYQFLAYGLFLFSFVSAGYSNKQRRVKRQVS